MSSGNNTRRFKTVAINDYDSVWTQASRLWHSSDLWGRIGLCLAASLVLWIATQGWMPPFPYRDHSIPLETRYARVEFEVVDNQRTNDARARARQMVLARYELDNTPLDELREKLNEHLFRISQAETLDDVERDLWQGFLSTSQKNADRATQELMFKSLKKALEQDPKMDVMGRAVRNAFQPVYEKGVLDQLQHGLDDHNNVQIRTYLKQPDNSKVVDVEDVRAPIVREKLKNQLEVELAKENSVIADAVVISGLIYNWIESQKLPVTLTFDAEASNEAAKRAEAQVPEQKRKFNRGDAVVAIAPSNLGDQSPEIASSALNESTLALLAEEHRAFTHSWSWAQQSNYMVARAGLFVAVFTLLGIYLWYENRDWLIQWRHFLTLLLLFVFAAASAYWLWMAPIRAELMPIVALAMIIAILYHSELALLFSAVLSLVTVFSLGLGVAEFVTMASVASVASFLAKNVRSRTRLVFVGLWAAAVGIPTAIYVKIALGWPMSLPLLWQSLWVGLQVVLAGVALTALLPFLERFFDFQTDISLLELGVPTHPLLRELNQRAPGTYSHSINVASIAETAANAIGANGVLVRVAAYFHDIGKMRKPEYFIENQARGQNKHQQLLPSMSTLVIVAHVKDGAELARKYKLPKSIIDFIEQHHGTTVVEYFYSKAKNEEKRDTSIVEEADFRYPGPKPQTRETAVMMLADACESASRAMKEPTPARLEGLVEEMTQKRLRDGQFDECGITLKELHIVKESLIKSLNGIHHGRIKYPEQSTG